MDKTCQVKLLRVLQDRTYEVLGDSRQRRADVRVISATNADLRQMVADGTFREDLLYRINLITLHLVPLRERVEDIPLLVNHFIETLCRQNVIRPVRVTADAMNYLKGLPYTGNIRELKNLVERTLLVSGSDTLDAEDFKIQHENDNNGNQDDVTAASGQTLDDMERQAIIKAIAKYNGNMSQVAAALGISRGALYRRMEKYNLTN